MSERDLTVSDSDRSADDWEPWHHDAPAATAPTPGGAASRAWMGARIETAIARLTQRFSRRPKDDDGDESTALRAHGRRAGALDIVSARRASGDGGDVVGGGGAGRVGDAGGRGETISASRRPRRARPPRCRRPGGRSRCGWRAAFTVWWCGAACVRIADLREIPDRRSVAVRGIVIARRTAASALDGRAAVWSLTRFRGGGWPSRSFFHESAFDFLLDDGTDEPIWIEVAGGMLIEPFPPEERVQFHSTTLLELEHPFLTRLRIDSRHVRASEIQILPGDAIEVVGRLSRRLDPTVRSQSGRDPPQRRDAAFGHARAGVDQEALGVGCGAGACAAHRAAGNAGAVSRRAAAAPFLIAGNSLGCAARGLAPALHLLHTAQTAAGASPRRET